MSEEPARNSTLGAIAEDSDGEMQTTKETMHGFLRKLNHDDFLCVITHNREFAASWKQTRDHLIIKFIHKYSMAQTYAVETSFWVSDYRPKLEKDFVDRMVTPETETNVFGLPSAMIIPESLQRKGKKNAVNPGPFPKVLLEPGTHMIDASGMYLVIDRATPGFSPHIMGDSSLTEHYLVHLPYAKIENVFFNKAAMPAVDSNGLAHPSEDATDTTTEEDENPPHLEMSSTSITAPPGESPSSDVKEEQSAEETRNRQKMEEMNKSPLKIKIKMPSLAPQIGKTKGTVDAVPLPSQSTKKGERTPATRAGSSRISESNEAVVSNGVKEGPKDKDEAESAKARKARASSGSKREPWKDAEIVPKDAKRVSNPTARKRQLEEEETTENSVKRSRERSTLASPTGSKERSTAKSQSRSMERSVTQADPVPATTPPPDLEKMDNDNVEPIKKKIPRVPSILEQLEMKVDEAAPLSTPLYTPSNLIGCKPPTTTPRPSIHPPAGMRVARIDMSGSKFVKRENGSSTPAMSRPQGSSVVIGLKPVPKEQLKRHTPKKEGKKEEEKSEEKEEKEQEPVIMRSRSTRAAAVKAQKETRKMKRMLAASESDEEEYLDAEEESGNEGDERPPSDDEDTATPRLPDAPLFGEDNDPSRVSTVEEGEVEGAADVVEIKEEIVWDDERDPDARTRNEQVLQRIAQEKANADQAQKQLMEKKERGEGVKVLERTPPLEKKDDKKDKKESKETAVAVKQNGIACKPCFSMRNDRFFLVSMQGGDRKNGPFLMRSLAQIYEPCRDWYRSLLKDEPCLEWYPRPHIGCDGDGNVHHVSGFTVKVANPMQFQVYTLDNLFNHREYRLGEIVWGKFGKEFWPGYIKAFIPAEAFAVHRGDVVMIQWISEPETYNYLSYADIHHFDLYFAIIFMPAKMDKGYINNVAKAISIDGKPGYWEEHISKPVFYEMKRLGGNISSIPKEELERIELNAKAKNVKGGEFERLLKIINLKEVYHFETHYRATYSGRNLNHFVPKADACTELLSRDPSASTSAPAREDDDEDHEEEEDTIPTPSTAPKRSYNKKTPKETAKETAKDSMMSADGVALVGINPDMSSLPLFARQQTLLKVVDKTGGSRSHVMFGEASRSPVDMALDEVATGSNGIHFPTNYIEDTGARNRLNSYLTGEQKKESRKSRRGRPEDVSSAATQEDSEEIVSSEITSFEVLHLKDELQVIIDPSSMANDAEWQKNTQRCGAIKSTLFRHEDKRRREHNEKELERRQKLEEEKERVKAEMAEKSAFRQARLGTPTQLTLESVIASKRSRQSRVSSETSDKPDASRETSVKRSRTSKDSETEKTPVYTPTSTRGRKRKT